MELEINYKIVFGFILIIIGVIAFIVVQPRLNELEKYDEEVRIFHETQGRELQSEWMRLRTIAGLGIISIIGGIFSLILGFLEKYKNITLRGLFK